MRNKSPIKYHLGWKYQGEKEIDQEILQKSLQTQWFNKVWLKIL